MNKGDVIKREINFEKCDLKQNSFGEWDFYAKDGVRITFEKFDEVTVFGGLVKVLKHNFSTRGVYTTEGEEILPAEWRDVSIGINKSTNKAAYILIMDDLGRWGVCNLDGSIILKPTRVLKIRWIKHKYVELVDVNENEITYEVTDKGLVKVN